VGLSSEWPHWLRDIDANLVVTPQYIVHGNIRDLHLVPSDSPAGRRAVRTVDALWAALSTRGYEFMLYHSPADGLRVVPPDADSAARDALKGTKAQPGSDLSWFDLGDVVHRVAELGDGGISPGTCALVIDYQSQQRPAGSLPSQDLHDFMLTSLTLVHQSVPVHLYNPVFWLVDRPSDLPLWMVGGSDGIRQVPIPTPDLTTRMMAAAFFARGLPRAPLDDAAAMQDLATTFAFSTEGLTIRSMSVIGRLAGDAGLDATDIEDAARAYRLGLIENKWKQPELRRRIASGEETLADKVLGQPRAVAHATDVLVRSTMALSGAWQGPRSSGPRGVMFFAGPTGVGKTELAKAITELVFGDSNAYIRFDMSEFASEHTQARLLGSPPGYIGHGKGGELTDAVRRKPMSVILFDEIEKAHPRILDKFLQILSDGRLTDGSGATVYFTDAILIFTSNLGVEGIGSDAPDYVTKVRESVERTFRDEMNRPELLGRIGDNIVVFDYLTDAIGQSLVHKYVANVVARVQVEHDIELTVPEEILSRLVEDCTADMALGARGVGQELDSRFVNPLGRALVFVTGSTATVTSVREKDGKYEVQLL
jgi:Cdc48 subfamily AAA family protein